jgi:small-conductance mechanosensitive channel
MEEFWNIAFAIWPQPLLETSDAGGERGIRSDLRFTLTAWFAEHDISIPFPQRDVHLCGRDA